MLQQMEAVGHLARRGSPGARRFRIRPRAIPHEPLDSGMRLKPLGHGGGLPIREQGEGPPFEVQQERAIGMTLRPRKIIHAQDLRGDNGGAGGAADHPQQRVTTPQEAELPPEPNPGSPTQRQAHGEETCRQPQGPPCPRCREAGQSLSDEGAWACGRTAEELTDAEPPRDPIATPREVGEDPSVTTMEVPCRDIAPRASGFGLC
jgi:hypothetical protein